MWDLFDAQARVTASEHDDNRDGTVDKRQIYGPVSGEPDRRVIRISELDIDASGQPGVRVYFREDGTQERMEILRLQKPKA